VCTPLILLPFTNPEPALFQDGTMPDMVQITHIHDNPHWFVGLHHHPTYAEIIYVDKGQGTYAVGSSAYSVKAGELVIVNGGVLHSVLSSNDNPLDAWTCTMTGFRLPDLPDNQLLPPGFHPILDARNHTGFFLNVFQQIYQQRRDELANYSVMCSFLAASLIVLTRQLSAGAGPSGAQSAKPFTFEIMEYINDHYQEPITLKKLSKIFHMSPDYISHAVAEEFAISPINHLINCRITESIWLLIRTDEPIPLVALKVGYDNPYYFTKLFTKRMGLPPSEFREKYKLG